MSEIRKEFRDLTDDGKIGFSIRDHNNPEVEAVHDRFKDFCYKRAYNNYTLELKLLLDNFEGGDNYNLYREVASIREELNALKASMLEANSNYDEVSEDDNAF